MRCNHLRENVWKKKIKKVDKYFNIIMIIVLMAYFMLNFSNGLIKGGRWDLYQNIAMADRFLDGKGFYYSVEEASSPYFPGVAFLAIGIGFLCNAYRDYVLLFIASAIGTLLLALLIKMGEKLSGNKYIALIVTSLLIFMEFDVYKIYMNEFKADSAVLVAGIALVYIITKIEDERKGVAVKDIILIFISSFVMDVTKQQALYVDVALGLYILITKNLQIRDKIAILASMLLAGVLDLMIIFSIPGLPILAIQNLRDMPFWSLEEIITQMWATLIGNILFFVLLFAFLIYLITRKIELSNLAAKWLLISVIFGCAQIAGGWKNGGNRGNYEVGMVTFLPFVVIAATKLFEKYIADHERINALIFASCCMTLASCAVILVVIFQKVPNVVFRIQNDKEVSQYLSDTIGDETIMYYSNQYMQIARSTVNPGMDLYATPYNIEEYWGYKTEKIESRAYKYIYVMRNDLNSWDAEFMRDHDYDSHLCESLDENYILLEDENMPSSLVGQLYMAKQ